MTIYLFTSAYDVKPRIISEEKLREIVNDEIDNNLDIIVGYGQTVPNHKTMSLEECVKFLFEYQDNFTVWIED